MNLILLITSLWLLVATPGWAQPGKGGGPLDQRQLALLETLPLDRAARENLKADLTALWSSYPGFISGVNLKADGKVFLIMKNRAVILYDDGRPKSFEERLARPDLQDMLAPLYQPGPPVANPQPDHDPGRFRVAAFFDAVYGSTAGEVRSHLTPVRFAGQGVSFSAQNGAALALARVGDKVADLLKRRPELKAHVFPLGGTFAFRPIAGTDNKSPHAWGIAIDLNPKKGAYWRWDRGFSAATVSALQKTYPFELVKLFEEQGFIWGGKWWHYDTLHFEYRPELLKKTALRQSGGRAR